MLMLTVLSLLEIFCMYQTAVVYCMTKEMRIFQKGKQWADRLQYAATSCFSLTFQIKNRNCRGYSKFLISPITEL